MRQVSYNIQQCVLTMAKQRSSKHLEFYSSIEVTHCLAFVTVRLYMAAVFRSDESFPQSKLLLTQSKKMNGKGCMYKLPLLSMLFVIKIISNSSMCYVTLEARLTEEVGSQRGIVA